MISEVSVVEPDITLSLDLDGVVRDATLSTGFFPEDCESWIGCNWTETVTSVSAIQVRRIVDSACSDGISAFQQITQKFPSGLEVPIEYTVVRLGGAAGLIAVGKSLQAVAELQSRLLDAQQAMERDYWRLREVETRYRMLFDASNEAVFLVDATDLKIAECNPAAIRVLGLSSTGHDFMREVAQDDRETVYKMLETARVEGKAPRMSVHLGPDGKSWMIRASMVTSEADKFFLLQLSPIIQFGDDDVNDDESALEELFVQAPDGIVLMSPEGEIRRANPSFLDMIQVGAETQAQGQRLSRWLGRPGADMSVLMSGLRRHQSVRQFTTRIEGTHGSQTEVEVSAAGNFAGGNHVAVVLVRDVGANLSRPELSTDARRIVLPSPERIGERGISGLVDEVVAIVEKYTIQAALDMTDQNRTAAAELLGVSRQSLYLKLSRYEIESKPRVSRDKTH